jgi:hypothetical protein
VSDRWRIAQINVAKFREPREHPVNADFEAALDEVNALAEAAPGFVWRMKGEGDSDDTTLTVNITVWQSIDQLAPSPTATSPIARSCAAERTGSSTCRPIWRSGGSRRAARPACRKRWRNWT